MHFIKTEIIDKTYSKLYSDLFDWRQKGDYNDFFDFSKEDVTPLIKPTEELIGIVRNLIHKN